MTLERIEAIRNLTVLDPMLSYVCKNPDLTDGPRYRAIGDGQWQLEHSGRETTFIMREDAVKRQLIDWRAKCGSVMLTVCSKCAEPVLSAVVSSIGGSHGFCPGCVAEQRAALARLVTER